MALDERLRAELERAARPADPTGVYEDLIRRRERRRIVRRLQAGSLALVVLAGTVGGFLALNRIFRQTDESPPVAAPSVSNGLIVFSQPLESGGEHVFAVAQDGTGYRQLTPEGRAVYRSPDVSPDGRTVVVVHEIPSFEPLQSVLATVPVEGGSPTWLSEEPWIIVDPTWSPDGERIAFAGSPGGPYGIYVLDVATGAVQLVPGTEEIDVGNPTWSPSGTEIAFEAWDGTQPERWDIYSMRLDGSGLTNLTRTPDVSETWPAWSWEVDRIAFVRGGGRPGLHTMAADGTDQILVTDELPAPASPVWSPDGAMIAFSADTGQVHRIRPDGSGLEPVTGALGEPSWQPLFEGATIPPIVPTPTPTPDSANGDIGLGFPVCGITSVSGEFVAGVRGTGYVATRAGDVGECPTYEGGFQVLAVDVTGDGLADTSYGPLECDQACSAFAAPDVDGDGTDEILVQNIQFSIAGLKLFEVQLGDGGAGLGPVIVAPPGTAAFGYQGFEGGTEPQLWLGGDAGNVDAIRCEPFEGGHALVSTTSSYVIDVDTDRDVTETWFVLEGFELRVVDVREYSVPVNDDTLPFFATGGCGTDLEPWN